MAFGHHKTEPQNPAIQSQSTTTIASPSHQRQQNQEALQRPTRGHGGLGGHKKMSAGRWFRLYGVDLITMAAMGAIGLGIYEASPAPSRNFPIYFADGQIVMPEMSYPLRNNIIPIWAAALIAFFVPFVFIALFQIRRRSFEDLTGSTMGVLFGLITAAVFQVFIKWLIGGLRPHFLAVCKPNILAGDIPSGTGFGNIMYDRTVCTGDESEINDSLESLPSGHSTAAGAGLVYCALYLNAQLKVMSDHRPAYWKFVLMFAPLLGAMLIGLSLTIDEYHHWYDILVGGSIGTLCAIAAYRSTFASLFDYRFNHILLPRTESLFLRRNPDGEYGSRFPYDLSRQSASELAPFSREGGWGVGADIAGAPGDAIKHRSIGGGGMMMDEEDVRGSGLGGHGAGARGAGLV